MGAILSGNRHKAFILIRNSGSSETASACVAVANLIEFLGPVEVPPPLIPKVVARMYRNRPCMAVLLVVSLIFGGPARADTFTFVLGDWPPFVGKDLPGHGLHARRVTRVFRDAGHDVRFEFRPWLRAYEVVRNGSEPSTFPWAYTEERARNFYFSTKPVGTNEYVLFYRKDRFPDGLPPLTFAEIRDRNLSIVAIEGYWYLDQLTGADLPYQNVATEKQAWNMLGHGRVDLYFESSIVGGIQSRQFLGDMADEITSTGPVHGVTLYMLFSKTHPDGRRMKEIWERETAPDPDETQVPAIR